MGLTATSKPFKSGNSQVVRLPKHMAYPDDVELILERNGDVTTMRPKQDMKALVEKLRSLPVPSKPMKRDPDIFPDRPGLYGKR